MLIAFIHFIIFIIKNLETTRRLIYEKELKSKEKIQQLKDELQSLRVISIIYLLLLFFSCTYNNLCFCILLLYAIIIYYYLLLLLLL